MLFSAVQLHQVMQPQPQWQPSPPLLRCACKHPLWLLLHDLTQELWHDEPLHAIKCAVVCRPLHPLQLQHLLARCCRHVPLLCNPCAAHCTLLPCDVHHRGLLAPVWPAVAFLMVPN